MPVQAVIHRRSFKVIGSTVKKIEGIDPWRKEFLQLQLEGASENKTILLHVKSFKSPKGRRHIIPFVGYDPKDPAVCGRGHYNEKTRQFAWAM